MKKLLFTLAALGAAFSASADEGMWLLPYLRQTNLPEMRRLGCRVPVEAIYSETKPSLKDAVVIFGEGCTGEIVSPEGLLLTNHHCGFGAIQSLSTVENDLLRNGFWACSAEEELPAPGLRVRFIRSIREVTDRILGNVPSTASQQEWERLTEANRAAAARELEAAHPNMQVVIEPFFEGNRFFAFVVEEFRDVRLVGTPPQSIGKFGGDTDNWMWPRHTGDFSVFRVYATPDNRPADYAPENRPYRTDNFLKVSLGGYDEGDFAMIMGFPGSTERYMTAAEIDRMLTVTNPQRILIRGERQAILREAMAASDRVRIQYASKYAVSSNYWKNAIGMSRGIEKLGVKARKEAQEAAFQRWAETETLPVEGFAEALPAIRSAVGRTLRPYASAQFLDEAFTRSIEVLRPARLLTDTTAFKGLAGEARRERLRSELKSFYRDFDPATDRRVAARMLALARERCADLPSVFAEVIDPCFGGDTDAYVDSLYRHTRLLTMEDAEALLALDSAALAGALRSDPAVRLARSVVEKRRELVRALKEAQPEYEGGRRLYVAGLMRMEPTKAWSPDANFTLRLTYGRVLPYDPADGIRYRHYTTLRGVIEKEDPDNPVEFTVPGRLKELYAARDFGPYANDRGELPVAFLADCDITGGNSGSPVMNGRGELIGLAFDGNWEAMSGDVAFEPELQRTISVDIRYVLFVMDKFAGARRLIDEMQLVP